MEEGTLKILLNPTRLRILEMLAEHPFFLTELSEKLRIAKKVLLKHLEELEKIGLVYSKRHNIGVGRPRRYFYLSEDVELVVKVGNMVKRLRIKKRYLKG